MFSKFTKTVALFISSVIGINQAANAQCTLPLNNGKSITFRFTAVAVIPNNCGAYPSGYNYDFKINYNTSITGGQFNIWHFQANFDAGKVSDYNKFQFQLSQADIFGGSGSLRTTNDQGRTIVDCPNATPANMDMRNLRLTISSSEGNYTDYNANCNFQAVATTNNTNSTQGLTFAPLPVKLISFDGAVSDNKVNLAWVTATETNNAYFILERSQDAQSWDAITKMDGAGTTRFNTTYNYTDEMPKSGTNYYRLKQVDENGTATYSRTLAVEAKAAAEAITLYPNPATTDNVRIKGMSNGADWTVKVINTSSAVVYQGNGAQDISLSGAPAGIYFVQMHNETTGSTQVLKLVKN